jgi:hypothetical protein
LVGVFVLVGVGVGDGCSTGITRFKHLSSKTAGVPSCKMTSVTFQPVRSEFPALCVSHLSGSCLVLTP